MCVCNIRLLSPDQQGSAERESEDSRAAEVKKCDITQINDVTYQYKCCNVSVCVSAPDGGVPEGHHPTEQ